MKHYWRFYRQFFCYYLFHFFSAYKAKMKREDETKWIDCFLLHPLIKMINLFNRCLRKLLLHCLMLSCRSDLDVLNVTLKFMNYVCKIVVKKTLNYYFISHKSSLCAHTFIRPRKTMHTITDTVIITCKGQT